MYVIAGVSGHTGSAAATALLADGRPVRVIVRDAAKGAAWKARGTEVAVASLDDRAALARALRGADGAYLLIPPGPLHEPDIAAERRRLSDAIAGAVADARPAHVVLLSSIGAELPSGTGPIAFVHALEGQLRATGVPATFLRAAFFMENWAAMLKGAIEGGALHHAVREGLRFSQVATADIGRTAARLLVEGPPQRERVVQLAGPADLTLADTAAAIGRVAGAPIEAVSVPPSALVESFIGMGAAREFAAMYGEMVEAMNEGRIAWQPGDLRRGSITLEQRIAELLAAPAPA
ncbi:MAG TPA: NmrA family NAD(P)-binding protein [Kofleriaceae bacterium]|nr:NmrA family NAD(P)-binding protein [Kofleriaceae bacterium]